MLRDPLARCAIPHGLPPALRAVSERSPLGFTLKSFTLRQIWPPEMPHCSNGNHGLSLATLPNRVHFRHRLLAQGVPERERAIGSAAPLHGGDVLVLSVANQHEGADSNAVAAEAVGGGAGEAPVAVRSDRP